MADEQNKEERRLYILNRIQEMCYFDDDFMTKCFENYPEGVELLLRIILGNTKLTVTIW